MRSSLAVFIFVFYLFLATDSRADIASSLLVWWKFDDGSGASAADSSGNGNTGTVANSPAWASGKILGALSFSGTNQYVLTPNLGTPPQSVSLSAWINSQPAGGVVLSELGQATVNSGWHDSQIEVETNGTVKACVWSGALTCVSATASLTFNQWHQVVMTYNVGTHTLSGYMDGVFGASTVITKLYNTPLYYAAGPPDTTNAGNGAAFSGTIDDVRIFSRALSAADVSEMYTVQSSVLFRNASVRNFHS